MKKTSILIFLIIAHQSYAQSVVDTNDYLPNVVIDEVIITQHKLDVPSFIRYIKTDTSFYKAFKNIRFETFNVIENFTAYNAKGNKAIATQYLEAKQIYRGGCRSMNILEEKTTGNFYDKKKAYNYYTAEMFASLFHTKGKVCNESRGIERNLDNATSGKSGLEKRKAQLKQLIFNPGSRVDDIPFFGKKSSIFTDNMIDKHQYKISDETKNGESCYKFDATPLPQYKKDVVINKITTWFRKSDYSIVSRTYNLSYHGMGYDFDVVMMVDLANINGTLLPKYINYNGNWHITTQGRERVRFSANFYY